MLAFKRFREAIQTKEPSFPPWRWALPGILIFIYLVVSLLSLLLVATILDDTLDNPQSETLIFSALVAGMLTLALVIQYTGDVIVRAREEKSIKDNQTFYDILALTPSHNAPLWAVLFLALGIAIATDTIGFLVGVPEHSLPLPLNGLDTDKTFLLGAGLLVIIVLRPLVEELIFRGIFYPGLTRAMPNVHAVIFSSLVFTAFHYVLDPAYLWWGLAYPLVLGLTAGFARAATKSTQVAIGVHTMFGIFIMFRTIL